MGSTEVACKTVLPRNCSLEDLRQHSLNNGGCPESKPMDGQQKSAHSLQAIPPSQASFAPNSCGLPYPVPYPYGPPGFGFGMMPPSGFPCWPVGPIGGQQQVSAPQQQSQAPQQIQQVQQQRQQQQCQQQQCPVQDKKKSKMGKEEAGEDFVTSCLLDKPVDELPVVVSAAPTLPPPRALAVRDPTANNGQGQCQENWADSETTQKKQVDIAGKEQSQALLQPVVVEAEREGGQDSSDVAAEMVLRTGLQAPKQSDRSCANGAHSEDDGDASGVQCEGASMLTSPDAEKGSSMESQVAPEGGASCASPRADNASAAGEDVSNTNVEVGCELAAGSKVDKDTSPDAGALPKAEVGHSLQSPGDGMSASSISAAAASSRPESKKSCAVGSASAPAARGTGGQEVAGPKAAAPVTPTSPPKPGPLPPLQRSHTSPGSLRSALGVSGQNMQPPACPFPPMVGLQRGLVPMPGSGSGLPGLLPFPGMFPGQGMPPWYAPFGPPLQLPGTMHGPMPGTVPGAAPGAYGFLPNPLVGQMPSVGVGVAQGFPVSPGPVPLGPMGHLQATGMQASEGMRNLMLGLVPVSSGKETAGAGPSGALGGDTDKASKKKVKLSTSCPSLGVLAGKGQKRPRKAKKPKAQGPNAAKEALQLAGASSNVVARGAGCGLEKDASGLVVDVGAASLPVPDGSVLGKGESEGKAGSSAVEEMQNNDNLSIAQRRPKRVPGGDPLQIESVCRLCDMIRNNSTEFEAQGRILRLKQYLKADARPNVMNSVLEALKENTRVEALYIQNFEWGMYDEQLELLADVLKQRRIWALNVGENFHTSLQAWEAFAMELAHTDVAYLYVSEHHLVHTNLKSKMRDIIRVNRKRAPARDPEVIANIKNMWFNPKLPGVKRADWSPSLASDLDPDWACGLEPEEGVPELGEDLSLTKQQLAGVQNRHFARMPVPRQGASGQRRTTTLRAKRLRGRKSLNKQRQAHLKASATGLQSRSGAGSLLPGSRRVKAGAALFGTEGSGSGAGSEVIQRIGCTKRVVARKGNWSPVSSNGMRLRSSGRKRVWHLSKAPNSPSVVDGLAPKRRCVAEARLDDLHEAGEPEECVVTGHTCPHKNEGGGRATFADVVNAGLICPGKYRWTVGQDQSVEVDISNDGAILYKDADYCSISSFALSVIRERNPGRRSCDGWKDVKWKGQRLEVLREQFLMQQRA
eukprot:evm.model.scf_407EXC.2 EVM.evm.TU.scf_407EXC.2   scf_407EXC:14109-19988(-)